MRGRVQRKVLQKMQKQVVVKITSEPHCEIFPPELIKQLTGKKFIAEQFKENWFIIPGDAFRETIKRGDRASGSKLYQMMHQHDPRIEKIERIKLPLGCVRVVNEVESKPFPQKKRRKKSRSVSAAA